MPRFISSIRHVGLGAAASLLCLHASVAAAPERTAGASRDDPPALLDYTVARWGLSDGAPSGIRSLAQDKDGYLWLGSDAGLFRFDGLTFERVELAGGTPNGGVGAILAARDGVVWAGWMDGTVTAFRNGRLVDMHSPAHDQIVGLFEGHDGSVWANVGLHDRSLMRLFKGKWQSDRRIWNAPADYLVTMAVDASGNLWATTLKTLSVLRRGASRFQLLPIRVAGRNALVEAPDGRMWLSDEEGTRAISGPASPVFDTPIAPTRGKILFDKTGSLWGTAPDGVYRVRAALNASNAPTAELWSDKVHFRVGRPSAFLLDREGNLWVGGELGIAEMREASIIRDDRIPATYEGSFLFRGKFGEVYIATDDVIFSVVPNGTPRRFASGGGKPQAMCDDRDGRVWTVRDGDIRSPAWPKLPRPPYPDLEGAGIFDCAFDRSGAMWLSAGADGMFRWEGGRWRQFPVGPPGPPGDPAHMLTDLDGRILTYYRGGPLLRIDYPTRQTFNVPTRFGRSGVSTIYQGPRETLLAGPFGLARLGRQDIRYLPADRLPYSQAVRGIVQTPSGFTWLIGKALTRMRTSDLDAALGGRAEPVRGTSFDANDGLPSPYLRGGRNDIVEGGDGRLWLTTSQGVAFVQPDRLPRNPTPPIVRIRSLMVDGKRVRDPVSIDLPKGATRLEIGYTALSLSFPKRVSFRYRLEGVDDAWIDPGQRRSAFYTNLRPGAYAFRVIAANESGVWNREGATLSFRVVPTFLQSDLFKIICLLVLLTSLVAAYRLRLRHVTDRVRSRLEERLAERERIARELHDTLLQGFQGLVFKFQSVANRITDDGSIRAHLNQALDRADQMLMEGRDRVRELRASNVRQDLSDNLVCLAEELAHEAGPRFALTVEGARRELHPMVLDECERIAAEALRNAFSHARAESVEVVIGYHERMLRIGVRDNGIGMAPDRTAARQHAGHFGLLGMRERAALIDGELTVASRPSAGTDIVLTVPAAVAYANFRRRWRPAAKPSLWRRLVSRATLQQV